jgi:hypothetical protein
MIAEYQLMILNNYRGSQTCPEGDYDDDLKLNANDILDLYDGDIEHKRQFEQFGKSMLSIVQKYNFATLADAKRNDRALFNAAFLEVLKSVDRDERNRMLCFLEKMKAKKNTHEV